MMAVNDYFRNLASQAAAALSLPWQWIYAQWAHETGGFDSYLAKTYRNYAGLTSIHGGYRSYNSDQEFVDSYVNDFLKKMPAATSADSLEGFAAGLRAEGYYTDSYDNYLAGLQRWMPEETGVNSIDNPTVAGGEITAGKEPGWLEKNWEKVKSFFAGNPVNIQEEIKAREWVESKGPVTEEFKQGTLDLKNAYAASPAGQKPSLSGIADFFKTGAMVIIGLVLAVLGIVLLARQDQPAAQTQEG